MSDMVNHPDHYKSKSGLEAIDVIEAFTSDLRGSEATNTAQVIKYILRWKKKNGLQDLKKAEWYLKRLIKRIEENGQVIPDDDTNDEFDVSYSTVFDSMYEAQRVLESVRTLVESRGACTVKDYIFLREPEIVLSKGEYEKAVQYGWTNIDDVYYLVSTKDMQVHLNLPAPEKLVKENE